MKSISFERSKKDDAIGVSKIPGLKRPCLYYRLGNRLEVLASGLTDKQAESLCDVLKSFMEPMLEETETHYHPLPQPPKEMR